MELRKRHYEIGPEHRGWKNVDAWNAAYEQGEEWRARNAFAYF